MSRKIIIALAVTLLIVVGLSLCTVSECFFLPPLMTILYPPIATLYLVPTSLYICFLVLRRANAAIGESGHRRVALFRRIVHATGFGVFYVMALPIGLWFGFTFGSFLMQELGSIVNIGNISSGVILYSTIFVSILLITIIGILIGWLIGWLIGKVLDGPWARRS